MASGSCSLRFSYVFSVLFFFLTGVTDSYFFNEAILYALAKRLAKSPLSLPLTLHPYWLLPALLQEDYSEKYKPSRHKSDNVPPELAFISCVVVVLKLVYGLDGRQRYHYLTRHISPLSTSSLLNCGFDSVRRPTDASDPACALPTEEAYLATLRQRQEANLESKEELFSASSKMCFSYLHFCFGSGLGLTFPPFTRSIRSLFPIAFSTFSILVGRRSTWTTPRSICTSNFARERSCRKKGRAMEETARVQ